VQINLVLIAIGTSTYILRMRTLGRDTVIAVDEPEPAVQASES
jgi:hypothetical protein